MANNMTMEERLNSVRAGVLGANDGILTVVGVLFSVGAATTNQFTLLIAGVADLLACALSMASGEYASVSSQADSEKAVVKLEKNRLTVNPESVQLDLKNFYLSRGVTESTATDIAKDLMTKNPLQSILSIKYDIQINHYVNPWEAAIASLVSAAAGGLFPLLALVLTPVSWQFIATIVATTFAVALTGFLSALIGNGFPKKAIIRNIIIGLLTIVIHYAIGLLF